MRTRYIEWDVEYEEDENGDLMGEFSIIGDKGVIDVGFTEIDLFLELILNAEKKLDISNNYNVDPLIEPYNLFFRLEDDSLCIEYNDKYAWFESKVCFFDDVTNSIIKLIEFLESLSVNVNIYEPKLLMLKRLLFE